MKTFFNLHLVPLLFSLLIIVTVCGSTGCSSSGSDPSPLPVTLTGITATTGSITFTWTDPEASNFDHVAATVSGGSPVVISAGTGTWTATVPDSNTDYTFTFTSVSASGKSSRVITVQFSTTVSGSLDAVPISTAAELHTTVRNGLSGHYFLTDNIDLSGYSSDAGWEPLGNDTTSFTGSFNGCGFIISDLTINRPTEDNQGLFGYNGGTLTGIALENVSVTGQSNVGGLVGYNNYGSVSDSYVKGEVNGSVSTGGLVGYNKSGTITDSYATAVVTCSGDNTGGLVGFDSSGTITSSYATGTVTGGGDCTGGLAGRQSGTITGSYATGDVTGNTFGTGGLVGYNWAAVENSYARGAVTAPNTGAGLIGYNNTGATVTGSYATGAVNCPTGGGLAGYNGGDVSADSFWDTTTTGKDTTGDDEGTGMVTADMKESSNYTGWDFTTVWNIDATEAINDGYPYLRDNSPVE